MAQLPTTTMRLVGHHDPVTMQAWSKDDDHRAVRSENEAAAGLELPSLDPRWQLATTAYSRLQEGPLTPGQRAKLIDQASRMGLRTFDASLIIAIAQDHARSGRPLSDATPTLELVRVEPRSSRHGLRWTLAVACAAATTGLLMVWMAG